MENIYAVVADHLQGKRYSSAWDAFEVGKAMWCSSRWKQLLHQSAASNSREWEYRLWAEKIESRLSVAGAKAALGKGITFLLKDHNSTQISIILDSMAATQLHAKAEIESQLATGLAVVSAMQLHARAALDLLKAREFGLIPGSSKARVQDDIRYHEFVAKVLLKEKPDFMVRYSLRRAYDLTPDNYKLKRVMQYMELDYHPALLAVVADDFLEVSMLALIETYQLAKNEEMRKQDANKASRANRASRAFARRTIAYSSDPFVERLPRPS